MLNRTLRVVVILVGFILLVPTMAITIITYPLLNYVPLKVAIFMFFDPLEDDWNYKDFNKKLKELSK